MCVSAGVMAAASLATAAIGTAASIDNANYQNGMAQLQLEEQRRQLRMEREGAELMALEAQLERLDEFERTRATNMALMAASGVTNNSFLQGAAQDEEDRLRYDLSNIRLGELGQFNRLANETRATQFSSQISRANRNSAVIGSLLNFASGAGRTYQTYDVLRPPSAQPRAASPRGNSGTFFNDSDVGMNYGN